MTFSKESCIKEITEQICESEEDLKYTFGENILPFNEKSTPSVSYDYLLLDNSDYSFLNPEFNEKTCVQFPYLSDSHIYFQKIKRICTTNFEDLFDSEDRFFQKLDNPPKTLKEITTKIFGEEELRADRIPTFFEIRLYDNGKNNKAPRVFGLIGNMNIIYILFYDPFHQIYNKTGRM